ncbi:LacI family DNA-binding transcriptional regulator [Alkalihalobacillus sp. 1P02AB]|uniref:LacI family DNA-binding transcriptional regulator n=1 Tax=Alkalihalobacillus sp. 1P02AB TaxID=3132260 RepID=UPI0039A50016
MTSIKDVAKLAGVSVTTVSRVLNNKGYISSETKLKVKKAMQELDYEPNQIARSLLSNQSFIIGVVVPDLSHPLFAELVEKIEDYANERNYKILVCNSLQESEKEKKYLTMLKQNRVDGIIMCSHSLEVAHYRQEKLPIVSFDRIISSSIPYISSDNYRGGEIATEHLIKSGCKNLLHISGPLNYDLLSNRRADAFQLTSMRYEVQSKVIEGAYIKATTEDNLRFIEAQLGEKLREFDGVFCSNDFMAYSLYLYAQKLGIKVPSELKIIGYDYHHFTKMLQTPRLTTIKQPIDQIGKKLCSELIAQIESDTKEGHNTVVDVELIIGETT